MIKKITLAVMALVAAVTLFTSCQKSGEYWFMIGVEYSSKIPTKFAEYDNIVKKYYALKDTELKFSNTSEVEATEAATAIFDRMVTELDQVEILWDKDEYYTVTLMMDHPKLKLIKDKKYSKEQ